MVSLTAKTSTQTARTSTHHPSTCASLCMCLCLHVYVYSVCTRLCLNICTVVRTSQPHLRFTPQNTRMHTMHPTSRSLTAGGHRATARIHTPAHRSHDSVELTQILKSQCLSIATIHSQYFEDLIEFVAPTSCTTVLDTSRYPCIPATSPVDTGPRHGPIWQSRSRAYAVRISRRGVTSCLLP